MRRALTLLGAGLLAVALAACAPHEGTVTGKGHSPATTMPVTQCVPQPKGGCTMITTVQFYPETWTLTIDDGTDHGPVSVSQSEWDSTEVGDHWKEST